MKTQLILFLSIFYPFLGYNQPTEDKVTLSGEIMMGNNIQQAKPIPFQEAFRVTFSYYPKNGAGSINLEVDDLIRKEWYNNPAATRVRFYMPINLYNKLSEEQNNSFSLQGEFLYKLPISGKIDTVSRYLTISLNNYIPKPKTLNSTIELNPILLTEPERLTLTIMTNYIKTKLESSSASEDGFSNVVDKLKKFTDNFNGKIDYETMIHFYKLLVFTEEYVGDDKSNTKTFFNQEAKNLFEQISSLNNTLTNSMPNKAENTDRQRILNELVSSNEVYQQYQEYYAKLKEYNSQLKLILFFKTE